MTINLRGALGLAGALTAALAATAPAHAQSATGDVSVRVLQAITVTKSSDLSFGKVLPASAPSTVAIAEDGTRTCGTGLKCFGTTTSGGFNVTASTGETVSVSIDTPSITLSNGGSQTMGVTLNSSTRTMSLPSGSGSFRVGGTLSVGANQAAGNYSGQYTVSVAYQ